jgi:hypothetical protein
MRRFTRGFRRQFERINAVDSENSTNKGHPLAEQGTSKKPYNPPELRCYGRMADLTRNAAPIFGGSDFLGLYSNTS